jgi:hypothetical protein
MAKIRAKPGNFLTNAALIFVCMLFGANRRGTRRDLSRVLGYLNRNGFPDLEKTALNRLGTSASRLRTIAPASLLEWADTGKTPPGMERMAEALKISSSNSLPLLVPGGCCA